MRLPRIVLVASLLLTALLARPDRRGDRVDHPRHPGPLPLRAGRADLRRRPVADDHAARLVRLLQRQAACRRRSSWSAARSPPTLSVARLVADAGFEIGNHTWDHADLTDLSRREIRRRAGPDPAGAARGRRHAVALRAPAVRRRRRPGPRGSWTGSGVRTAFWTVDSEDWTGLTPRQIRHARDRRASRTRGRAGSVVLHHDGVDNSPAILAALPREIDRLRADGYCFVDARAGRPGHLLTPLSRGVRAYGFTAPGGPEHEAFLDVPEPTPGPGRAGRAGARRRRQPRRLAGPRGRLRHRRARGAGPRGRRHRGGGRARASTGFAVGDEVFGGCPDMVGGFAELARGDRVVRGAPARRR